MNPARPARQWLQRLLARLTPRQQQYAMLAGMMGSGVGLLWLALAFTDSSPKGADSRPASAVPSSVTQIGVLPPGGQVNPVDQWVGTAGRKLAQYESERDEQERLNKERQAFEARTLQRFAELEQKLGATPAPAPASAAPPAPLPSLPSMPPLPPALPAPAPAATRPLPPLPSLPPVPAAPLGAPTAAWNDPGNAPATPAPNPPVPAINRITLAQRSRPTAGAEAPPTPLANATSAREARSTSTFLPVSFTRGTLLGGLDAPTGGQAQSNPHPVLIRLSDTSILPNRFRGAYRDCFVVAAGYGDISSERAYLRTESMSCVRADGATLEVRIQGSVYGEDGKVGMRGRLVTKQGQILANALLAGVVSGIGQGVASASTEYSTSALGTVASAQGADAYRAGVGSGVGRALDRLAQYYIKLAENTFPVIEVDAGREIDVVITRGVRIDVPMAESAEAATPTALSPETRYLEATDDAPY